MVDTGTATVFFKQLEVVVEGWCTGSLEDSQEVEDKILRCLFLFQSEDSFDNPAKILDNLANVL